MVARAQSGRGKASSIVCHQRVWRGRAMYLHDLRLGSVRDFAGLPGGQLSVEIALGYD